VLADRYAALSQGGQNLIDGLLAVVRQSIEFPLAANHALNQAVEAKKPVRNLYVSGLPADAQDQAARELETELSRATSPYDSHPALKERIAWIERLQAGCPQDNGGGRPALRLLPNAEALQRELTSALVSAVQA
jgi:Zn-dependent protease with chaperone function